MPKDRRWLLVALVVAIPVLVLIGALSQRTWYPTGDQAQAELRMRSMPDDAPLLGAAGRIVDDEDRQGNHPGPLMFWVTWPAYELLGGSSWAFEAATALVNVGWLVLSVWLVHRRAGPAVTAWFGVVALVLIGGFGLDALSQPWNPWVALLPFTALVLATWGALERERWAPVFAVAAASYALQGHIGYLPLVVPLAFVAVAAPVVRWWRERRAASADAAPAEAALDAPDASVAGARADRGSGAGWWAIPLAVALVVGLLAWSGPILDALTNDPSNVSKLLANFGSPDEDPIGIARAIEAVLQSISPVGPWVWGGVAVEGSAVPGLLLLVAWAAVAGVVAVRRTDATITRLNAVLAGSLLLGTIAVSRIFGALYLYTFRWIVVLAALMVFTTGWGLARLLPRPAPSLLPRLAAVLVVVLVGLSAVTTVRISRQEIPYDQSWRAMQVLAPEVAGQLDPSTRYLVRWDDPAFLGGLGFGLVLDLERRGFDVGTDPQFVTGVERHRVRCAGDYDAVLTVVTGERRIEAYRQRDGYVLLAETDPREDVAAWEATYAELVDALAAAGTPVPADEVEGQLNLRALAPDGDPEVTRLAGVLVLAGLPSAVFLQDPAPEPAPLKRSPLNEACWR